jgi:hypothetical protein
MVLPTAQVWKMQIQISTVLVQEYDTHRNTRVFIVMYITVFVLLLLLLFGGGGGAAAAVFVIIIIICEYKLQSNKEDFYCEICIMRTSYKSDLANLETGFMEFPIPFRINVQENHCCDRTVVYLILHKSM